ncbi:MAG: GNAT family N-acetyltransferase [Acidimicrobiia bacterium]
MTGRSLRVVPWAGGDDSACLIVTPGSTIDATTIATSLTEVVAMGYRSVVTSALARRDVGPFTEAGFTPAGQLHLLSHDMAAVPDFSDVALRRAHRDEWSRIVDVDKAAFEPFWHLGDLGLRDALDATPRSRLRVSEGTPVDGFAISGRAASRGYLQRLAVEPGAQRSGLGRALTIDALRWMKRRGVTQAFVNTQTENERALRLYESVGFRRLDEGLVVLRRSLEQT